MSTDDVTPAGRDEFDVDLVPGQRRGAHRTQSSPVVVALVAVFGILLIASLIISVVAVVGLPGGKREVAPPPTTTTEAAPLQASEPIQPDIDKGASLTVLNGTRVSGVTRRVRDELRKDGWIVDKSANNDDRSMPTTVVQYADPTLEQTANALKDKLGGGVLQKVPPSALDGADLRVIVGETYALDRGLIRRPSSSTSPTESSTSAESPTSSPEKSSDSPSSTRSSSRTTSG